MECSGSRLCCYFYNFYSISPRPICFDRCYGSFSLPLYTTASPSVAVFSCITYLVHLIPNYSLGVKHRPPGICPLLPPTSLHRFSLQPAPHTWFCCHVPLTFVPLLKTLAWDQVPVGPCWSLEVRPSLVHPSPMSPPLPPCAIPWFLSSSGAWYMIRWPFLRANVRSLGTSTPWQSLAPGPRLPQYL